VSPVQQHEGAGGGALPVGAVQVLRYPLHTLEHAAKLLGR
jgi:hypothetical protein